MSNEKDLGSIVFGFITILIGVVLLASLADSIYLATTTTDITNESLTISSTHVTITNETITISSGEGSTGNISVINITFFGNGTVNTENYMFNVSSDVNFTIGGDIIVDQNNFSDSDYNISYVYTTDAVGQTANEDLISVTFFGNPTVSTDSTGIAVNSEVNFTTAGVMNVKSLNFTDADYNASYAYEGSEYVANDTARALIPLTRLFFALAVMFAGVMMAFKGFKGMGIV